MTDNALLMTDGGCGIQIVPPWQPIETAPVGRPLFNDDGPRVLLVNAGCVVIGSYRKAHGLAAMWRDDYGGAVVKVTHWMPLPEPPTSTK